MTTRMFASPLFLGFDHLEQMLERAAKTSSDGYPPYNIEQTAPTALRITLAVAGFTMDDLQITQEDNQLVIRGRQTEVRGAWLDNGLLHIDLARPLPEVRVKTIQITRPHAASNGSAAGNNAATSGQLVVGKSEPAG
jgi:HSP20 family molecular chaperone IbpA